MIKKLIINADDFGMCEGNSLGYPSCSRRGTCKFHYSHDEYAICFMGPRQGKGLS